MIGIALDHGQDVFITIAIEVAAGVRPHRRVCRCEGCQFTATGLQPCLVAPTHGPFAIGIGFGLLKQLAGRTGSQTGGYKTCK
ncbi:hypothetical protein D9M70_591020 [compost metagenome]